MNIIATCGCADMDKFAVDAFKLIFPAAPLPPVISQNRKNGEFGKWSKEIDALFKSKAKFAYYLTNEELWDLKKGVRLA